MKYLIYSLISLISLMTSAQSSVFTEEFTQKEILDVTRILYSDEILDSLVVHAMNQSHLIKAIDQEVRMYDEEILQKKRSWVSSFRVALNLFSANTTMDPYYESVTTYGILPNVGLNLVIDPEKIINRQSYVRQSISKREYSRHINQDTRQSLKKEILNLYYDYLSLLETINIRQHALTTREQQEDYVATGFRNGEATYEQLLIAENQVHLAKEALMKASIEAMKKRSEIHVTIGLK